MSDNCLKPGDTMRFSLPLLKDIYEQPEHTSRIVEVVEIEIEPDGHKRMVVRVLDPTA
jgi:hypothetical protein